MRLDLFSKNDHVLLIGEGNFSFAVNLLNHKLPIYMVATCFEPEIEFDNQQENIDYLEANKVPVFLDVDATKLHEHPHITEQKYSKIIFNFPHVGGKMKIHLNRELLKKTFQSARHLLKKDGLLLISLCRGQGGTPADEPQRRWDDSWQITEMAAHGDFILIAVEPFVHDNFIDYKCIGYRSQDVEFNLENALVHIFSKCKPPYKSIDKDTVKKRLSLVPLDKNSKITVPVLYSELYSQNPLLNSKSGISYFKNSLFDQLKNVFENERSIKAVSDKDIPVFVTSERGVICNVDGKSNGFRLRLSATQILNKAICILENLDLDKGIVFFPGMYFNPLTGKDFLTDPPISFQFLILGRNASTIGYRYIYSLKKNFNKDVSCILRPQNTWGNDMPHPKETIESLNDNTNIFKGRIATEWVYSNLNTEKECVVCHVYSIVYKDSTLDACVIYPDKLAEIFFEVKSWRELWADRNEVKIEIIEDIEKPVLKQALLYPLTYEFDVTLRYEMKDGLCEDKVYQILWLSAGHLIQNVELLNEYHSNQGWSSKCYRITYKSLDKPLYRNRVIDIHANVVSKMLVAALHVVIN